jgi:CzcA family heavy metal efflux pump
MKVTEFSVNHSTAIFVLILSIFFGGIYAYSGLPKEAAPDVAIPIVVVNVPYFGASPSDIESLVTKPMERELKDLKNVDEMTSTSAESASIIQIEFDPSVNIDDVLQRVRAKVDRAESEIPDGTEDPRIIEINASEFPVLIANVSGDMDPLRLKEIGEQMQEDLEDIPGVLRVDLAGGVQREVEVNVNPGRLHHHDVAINEVVGAIQRENINFPGGHIDMGSLKYNVRVPGEFEYATNLEDVVIKAPRGRPITIGDVGTAEMGFEDKDTISRLTTWRKKPDGSKEAVTQPNVSLSLVKRAGANILRVANEAKDVINGYEERFEGAGVSVAIINDSSENIDARVTELENNIITGLLLVLGLLLFFMGGFRNALFVGVAIPLSMLLTFITLSMMGITLNMVVLFSLVLALGMLVDNAIVIVENIYRHATEGKPRFQAALDGTKEVGWPVIAATFTTVGAFFPMLFWPGVVGEFMGYLPLTVIVVLLSSLFVALIINPTICAVLLKVKDGISLQEDEVPDIWIYRIYKRSLEWSLRHRGVVMVLAVGSLVGTIALYTQVSKGVEFFPETTPEFFSLQVEKPDGTRLEETNKLLDRLAEPLETKPELTEAWIRDAGVKGTSRIAGGGQAPHYGQISVDLVSLSEQKSDPVTFMDTLRDKYDDVAGANVVLQKQEMGPPTGAPVAIEIVGDNLRQLDRLAQDVRDRIRDIPGITDLQDDMELSKPEIQVDVQRQQAAAAGLNTQKIAQTVRTALHGTEASTYRVEDDEYDITVQFNKENRQNIDDIAQMRIANRSDELIPLSEVADIEVKGGSGSIKRKDRERVVTVTANAEKGYLAANLLNEAREKTEDMNLPTGYEIRYTGEREDQQEAAEFLQGALLAAVFIIGMILVTIFDSVVQPLIILFSVLFSLIGVFWTLIIAGEPFGIIMTGIGVISLAGIVVNNSIVMVDYINILREDKGLDRRDAVIRGGLIRLRPVLLTAATTALGLAPIALGISLDFVNQQVVFGGSSVELWGPMAKVVTYGLIVATLMTLFAVPVMYSIFDAIADWSAKTAKKLLNLSVIAGVLMGAGNLTAAPDSTPDQPPAQSSETSVERKLSLGEALRTVRDKNYDIKLAANQVRQMDSLIDEAWSTVLPSLSVSGQYTIHDEEIEVDVGGENIPEGMGPDSFVVQNKTDYRWSATARLTLDARSYPGLQQAQLQREMAKQQRRVARQELELAVIDIYYNMLSLRRMIELSRQRLESAKHLRDIVEKRRAAQAANTFEATRARLQVVQARRSVEDSKVQYRKIRRSMAELLNTEPDFEITAPPAPVEPAGFEKLREKAVSNRAEYQTLKTEKQLAYQQIQEIRAGYLPNLSITGTYFGQKGTTLNPGEPRWQIQLGAEWMLWNGGRRNAQIDRRTAKRDAARIRASKWKSELDSELDQAYADLRSARIQVENSKTEVELAEKALEQTKRAYKHGAASQREVTEAQDELQIAEISLMRQRLDMQKAAHRLWQLSGEKLDAYSSTENRAATNP